jgi:hypothetical protein
MVGLSGIVWHAGGMPEDDFHNLTRFRYPLTKSVVGAVMTRACAWLDNYYFLANIFQLVIGRLIKERRGYSDLDVV